MKRKEIDPIKYIAAFGITALVFILGISIGNYFSDVKMSEIDELEQDIRTDTIGIELQYIIMAENPCSIVNSSKFTEELTEMGQKLTFMESELGKNDLRVIDLKKYHSLLEIRHWLFLKKAKEECHENFGLVLYFYSNRGDCDDCEEQGQVLTYVHKKYPVFNIYSFDINIENPALDALKEIYNIKTSPSLVIDDKTYAGFKNKDELIELLGLIITK